MIGILRLNYIQDQIAFCDKLAIHLCHGQETHRVLSQEVKSLIPVAVHVDQGNPVWHLLLFQCELDLLAVRTPRSAVAVELNPHLILGAFEKAHLGESNSQSAGSCPRCRLGFKLRCCLARLPQRCLNLLPAGRRSCIVGRLLSRRSEEAVQEAMAPQPTRPATSGAQSPWSSRCTSHGQSATSPDASHHCEPPRPAMALSLPSQEAT
mmetsp:Transcript_64740/g.141053  ORF Transcript_64740/g.141053 Transcript_64740/m.141053 type:complete len:208 (+) Transcript_64740:1755-2378(+)